MRKLNDITYSLKRYDYLDGNYTQISNDVYKMTTGNEFKIYSYLCMRYNKDRKYAFPSIRTMADDCNMSVKTVQKCITQLEAIGLIKILKFDEKTSPYANNMYRVYYPIILKNTLEEEQQRQREEELNKIIEEADNEVVGKIRTMEIGSKDSNSND